MRNMLSDDVERVDLYAIMHHINCIEERT